MHLKKKLRSEVYRWMASINMTPLTKIGWWILLLSLYKCSFQISRTICESVTRFSLRYQHNVIPVGKFFIKHSLTFKSFRIFLVLSSNGHCCHKAWANFSTWNYILLKLNTIHRINRATETAHGLYNLSIPHFGYIFGSNKPHSSCVLFS